MIEQQKEIINLLKTITHGQTINPIPVPDTQPSSSSGATRSQQDVLVHHPQSVDTESCILEDLLELTSDEEFMTSSSWNSILPEYPTSGSTLPPLQPPQRATALGSKPAMQQSITPEPQLPLQPTQQQQSSQQLTMTVPHVS